MQQFNCPFCGNRDQSEFTYVREISAIPTLDAALHEWQQFIYQRDNPCGAHAEWWHHNHGCRQMLEIVRDTLTHEVQSVDSARPSGSAS